LNSWVGSHDWWINQQHLGYYLFFCLMPFLPLNLKNIYIISLFVIDDLFFILLKPKKIQYHHLLSIINFYYLGITCLSWFFLLLKKLFHIKNYHAFYYYIIKWKIISGIRNLLNPKKCMTSIVSLLGWIKFN